MNYIFLMNQQIPNFERLIDALYIEQHIDLYVTGQTPIFCRRLATLLSGRYITIHVTLFL